MDNSGIIPKIRLGMFQPSGHALTLDNIAIIDDNLELAQDDRNIGAPTEKPLPNKILVALYMVCVEGEVELTLNQQNFHEERRSAGVHARIHYRKGMDVKGLQNHHHSHFQ